MNLNRVSFPASVSYWEIDRYLSNVDLLIVGSGIVGLTTAIFYKKQHPQKRVVIAEKGFLPSGASTKNAGFACFGSLSEILADLENSTDDEVFQLIRKRYNGLNELRQLLGDKVIDFQSIGGYEVFRTEDNELYQRCLTFLPEANRRLKAELAFDETYSSVDDQLSKFGFQCVSNMILNKYEGSIDTGKMMINLTKLASELGVIILNGLEVSEWSDSPSGVHVSFADQFELQPDKVHFATNGFTWKLLPELDVKPARAQVLITSPIPELRFKGTFHLDEGYYYFRNVGNRVLLGGGRNLDIDGETTNELNFTDTIQTALERLLQNTILPKSEFEIEHRWAGVMGVGKQKKAIVKQISSNVSCAVRLGGMGVAIGTSIGKESAELIG